MNDTTFATRLAQGLLAVTIVSAIAVVMQLALLD
jgi:hypothetical protein